MTFPLEYDRDRNVNTVRYWNTAHKRGRTVTPKSSVVVRRVAEMLEGLPVMPIREYGFGRYHVGMFVGPERWTGYDFSPMAVSSAKEEGFTAHVARLGDAEHPDGSCIVALEVIEHLDLPEMMAFLRTVSVADRAFISVPMARARDLRFPQHMRGFGTKVDLEEFLSGFWPSVTVEVVRPHWRLAYCRRVTP